MNDKSIENQTGKASLCERYVLFGAIVDHVMCHYRPCDPLPYVSFYAKKYAACRERCHNHAI